MARLLILRGETPHLEVELKRQTLRLGRSPQNDVRLEDEGKSVSRNHAEIRYEGGRYVLVDLDSQNGVWVSGALVRRVVLEPHVVASVGPYRLMLESGGGTTADPSDIGTLAVHRPDDSSQSAVDDVGRKSPPPDPQVPVPSSSRKPRPPTWFSRQPIWLLAAAGVAVVGVAAIVVTNVMRGPSPPPDDVAALMENHLTAASALVQAGDCPRALSEHIGPVLANDPANVRALALRNTCNPPPPPPPGLSPEEVRAHLEAAVPLIEARDCLVALNDHINVVLANDSNHAEALTLKVKADACQAPPPPPNAPPAVARRIPPEKGGLELRPGEVQKEYDSRVRAMRARYDVAVAALSGGEYQKAHQLFGEIVRDAGDRYLDAGQQLLRADIGLKETAQKIYAAAREHEGREEWDQAIQELGRARDTHPTFSNAEADIKRVTEKKTAAGVKKCEDGDANFLLKRKGPALQFYEEALRLLPADHACSSRAKERVAFLKN